MSDLGKKTRFCTVCIRKLKYPDNFDEKLLEYCRSFCERYTYIKHEHDLSTKNLLEDPHYHLVVVYKENQRLSTRLNNLCNYFGFDNPFGIKIERTVSTVASIQYLIHKNNPEKTQHSVDEIICNYDRTELQCIIDSESETTNTFDYILEVLNEESTLLGVISRLGLNTYRTYRPVIVDMIKSTATFKAKFNM